MQTRNRQGYEEMDMAALELLALLWCFRIGLCQCSRVIRQRRSRTTAETGGAEPDGMAPTSMCRRSRCRVQAAAGVKFMFAVACAV